ncbi:MULTISPECIES: MarR family transcriptional regulator [Luteimonas]|uniref:DNA-binding MarR family transcriptional regulator n=1 Tax=Luteimonas terrae TaxID=1530191 RepID=A0ABU1Y077_9GAMM|nr:MULTISPECIES: MarR family transcriptional regulator [Luteimonas]MDR6992657.1 DNA-binding MarR family transcriptional regulator [Luteimonas sp. 3794]MDR7194429.1 DNA-binding MarR family transcriptional regulator [Luteimonas terrae]
MDTTRPCASASGSSLGLLFRQVRDAMWARMADELSNAGHDLSFSQYITLKKLALGTTGATELARAAELNPGAMTRLIDKLIERGLVERHADPGDRRVVRIQLSAQGQSIWRDIDQCGNRVRERAMSGMDEAQRLQFIRVLEQVRDNLSFPGQ